MSSDKTISGICPIIATPFSDSGAVDYEGLDRLIRWIVGRGCHAVTLFGIAGEYYKLADDEKERMVDVTVAACRDIGAPSIVSVTDHATEVAVRRAAEWEAKGADCLMLLPPFFLKPSGEQLVAHTVAVANAVSIPVMLQYAPEQTGVPMTPEALVAIQEQTGTEIVYKIENRPPGRTISRVLELSAGRARVFIGNAGFQLIEGLDRGAVGVMPGCSMCDVYLKIYQQWREDRGAAIATHSDLLTVLNHIRQNVEQIIAFEKRILARRGVIGSAYCRAPGYRSDATTDAIFDELIAVVEPHFSN